MLCENKKAWLEMTQEAYASDRLSIRSNEVSFTKNDKLRLRLSDEQHAELAMNITTRCSKSMPPHVQVKLIELVANRIIQAIGELGYQFIS